VEKSQREQSQYETCVALFKQVIQSDIAMKQKWDGTRSDTRLVSRSFYSDPGLLAIDNVVLGIVICLFVITVGRTFIFGPLQRRM